MSQSSPWGVEIPFSVRRSTRAQRVRVNVLGDARVEVVLPSRAPKRAADVAVSELRPWIEARLADLRRAQATVAQRQGTLPYLDETLTVVVQPGRSRAHRRGEQLLVPPGSETRPAVERYYRRAARGEVASRLDRACAEAGLSYGGLAIRGQRTRWASCSARGDMSFNWRLLLAPERILQYVVWHEVCHLRVLDHSPRFWGLLEHYWPDWCGDRVWLRENGGRLVV